MEEKHRALNQAEELLEKIETRRHNLSPLLPPTDVPALSSFQDTTEEEIGIVTADDASSSSQCCTAIREEKKEREEAKLRLSNQILSLTTTEEDFRNSNRLIIESVRELIDDYNAVYQNRDWRSLPEESQRVIRTQRKEIDSLTEKVNTLFDDAKVLSEKLKVLSERLEATCHTG